MKALRGLWDWMTGKSDTPEPVEPREPIPGQGVPNDGIADYRYEIPVDDAAISTDEMLDDLRRGRGN